MQCSAVQCGAVQCSTVQCSGSTYGQTSPTVPGSGELFVTTDSTVHTGQKINSLILINVPRVSFSNYQGHVSQEVGKVLKGNKHIYFFVDPDS